MYLYYLYNHLHKLLIKTFYNYHNNSITDYFTKKKEEIQYDPLC